MQKLIGSFFFLFVLALTTAAFAGQLFPPADANGVAIKTPSCGNNQALGWRNNSVQCIDMLASTGTGGTGTTTITQNLPGAPTCPVNKFPVWNGSTWVCATMNTSTVDVPGLIADNVSTQLPKGNGCDGSKAGGGSKDSSGNYRNICNIGAHAACFLSSYFWWDNNGSISTGRCAVYKSGKSWVVDSLSHGADHHFCQATCIY